MPASVLLHKPWRARRFLPIDDRPGTVLLGGDRFVVSGCPFSGVGPYRPPRRRVAFGVPYRFGALVWVTHGGSTNLGSDRVDHLPIGEVVPVPAEMGLQVDRCLGDPRPNDKVQPHLIQRLKVGP